eukprot:1934294-Amphidinium_carterae.1
MSDSLVNSTSARNAGITHCLLVIAVYLFVATWLGVVSSGIMFDLFPGLVGAPGYQRYSHIHVADLHT